MNPDFYIGSTNFNRYIAFLQNNTIMFFKTNTMVKTVKLMREKYLNYIDAARDLLKNVVWLFVVFLGALI